MSLYHKIYKNEQSKEYLFILHGLFGTSDNWHLIARAISDTINVVTVDLRNHGKSIQSDEMSYALLASDVAALIDSLHLSKISLLGHSMGGKVAMYFADTYPHLLERLMVVDISPRAYKAGHEAYFDAYREIPWHEAENRQEADAMLAAIEPNEGIRLFLLKNLDRRKEGGFQLKINLDAIEQFYPELIGDLTFSWVISIPTLVIYGNKSGYVQQKDKELFSKTFTNLDFLELDGGHWIHAEKPEAFVEGMRRFLAE